MALIWEGGLHDVAEEEEGGGVRALNKEGRSLEVREEQRTAVHTSSEYGQAEIVPGLE